MSHIVIVGGGYAGCMAAGRLAVVAPHARVTLVDPSPVFVERVRLHQEAAGARARPQPLAERLPPQATHRQSRAVGLDAAGRRLLLEDGALEYGQLVLALGGSPRRLPGDGQGCTPLADRAQALALRAAVAALPPGARVAVVGAGATGVEVAAELAQAHPRLQVLLLGPIDLPTTPGGAAHVQRVLAGLGVEHHPERWVESSSRGVLQLRGGERLAVDLCVEALGVRGPAALEGWGLPLDAQGRLRVGPDLRVLGFAELWGIGDAAAVEGLPMRAACAAALPMGAFVADQLGRVLAGRATRAHSWSDRLICLSLGREEALVQPLRAAGGPLGPPLTGALGAWVKERICRMAAGVARWEPALGIRLYRWFPASPPLLEAR